MYTNKLFRILWTVRTYVLHEFSFNGPSENYVFIRWPQSIVLSVEIQLSIWGITLTGLTPPHLCVCPNPGFGFRTRYVMDILCWMVGAERLFIFHLAFLAVKYCQKSLKWVDYTVLTIFCVSCRLEIIKDNHHINYIHIQNKTTQNGAQWRESRNIFCDIDMFTWILLTIMTTDIRWFKVCIWI